MQQKTTGQRSNESENPSQNKTNSVSNSKHTPVLTKVNQTKSARTEKILEQIDQRLETKTQQKKEYSQPQEVQVRIISYKYYPPKPQLPEPAISKVIKPKSPTKIKRSLRKKLTIMSMVVSMGILLGIAGLIFKNYYNPLNANQADAAVLGVQDNTQNDDSAYASWIESKNNSIFSPKDADLDNDGLTNYEEFILDTNPLSPNTCNPDKTDSQNLINLIDPKTCKPINTDDDTEFKKFNQVINVDKLKQQLDASIQTVSQSSAPAVDQSSLQSVFGVQNLSDIDNISVAAVQQENQNTDLKVKYLNLINKIDLYISKYRSYDTNDRDYATPVSGAEYLSVSLKYNIPLKYLLAIARAESRFGTDRFTQDGNPTRPGAHQNIFSLGLTDSGSNITFPTWYDGVVAMGKWWQNFDQKGVSIDRRLKIFNPNGDYPGKIDGLASQIDTFLNS
jgi:hypothetical protein